MLNPHHPISQDKNKQKNRYGPQLITQLQEQEIAFKSFVSSLNKCPNRYPPSHLNPQQQTKNQVSSSKAKKPTRNLQTAEKSFITQKIQTIEKIKNSQDIPLTNFRITKLKNNQKSIFFDPFQTKSSRITKSMNKCQSKMDSNRISNLQQFPSQFQRNASQNTKNNLFQRSPLKNQLKSQFVKRSTSLMEKTIKNLRLQKTSCLSWDPNSKQFLSSLFSSSKQNLSTSQSNFLLSLLNLNIQSTINFLKQQSSIIQKINEIQAKDICSFFQNILEFNQIKPLEEPLIKKYSNCIFYGQKPNFVSAHAGIIIYFSGNSYFGSLFNFQKHGIGMQLVRSQKIKQEKSQNKFQKRRNLKKASQNQENSQGTKEFTIYQGKFQRNSKTGLFRVKAHNYIYEGELYKGFFEGQGTLINSKSTFKGKWQKNKKVNGFQIFNGEQMTYQGSYLDNKFHGFGQLRKNNQFYEGQFLYGLKNGKGNLVNRQYIYEGSFKQDLKHGRGTFFDKSQYKLNHKDLSNQDYDFNQCVYLVQFFEDQIIDKILIKGNKIGEFQQDNLQTFEQQNSQKSTLTLDFQIIRPSKLLDKAQTDRLYEGQENSKETFKNFQKYRRSLSVIPSEPEQQIQFIQKVNTYLTGNHSYHSPRKPIKKGY